MKKTLLSFIALLFTIALPNKLFAYYVSYGTPYTAPSGQTIYYDIRYYDGVSGALIVAPFRDVDYSGIGTGYYGWDSYEKPEGNLIIPDSINHNGTMYPVIAIQTQAFDGCTGITSIHVPSTVTTIEYQALYGVDTLWYSGSASSWSWNTCGANVWIRGYIEDNIEYTSAAKDSIIQALSIPDSVVLLQSVRCIMDDAFHNKTNLRCIVLPDSLLSIGTGAFYGTQIDSIFIPASVSFIGNRNLSSCSSIVVDSNNTIYDSRDGCNAIINTEANRLIVGCRTTVIPSTVTSIGPYAFAGISGLNIVIPETVSEINKSSFLQSSGDVYLTEVVPSFWGSYYDFYKDLTNIFFHIPCSYADGYYADNYWPKLNITTYSNLDYSLTLTADSAYGRAETFWHWPDCSAIISAVPNHGYHFSHWSNGSTANPDTIVMTPDSIVQAIFEKDRYTNFGIALQQGNNYIRPARTQCNLENITWLGYLYSGNYGYYSTTLYNWKYANDDEGTTYRYWINYQKYNRSATTDAYWYSDVAVTEYSAYTFSYRYTFDSITDDSNDWLKIGLISADSPLCDTILASATILRNNTNNSNGNGDYVSREYWLNPGIYRIMFYWHNDNNGKGYGHAPLINYILERSDNNIHGYADLIDTVTYVESNVDTAAYLDSVTLTAVSLDSHLQFVRWIDGETANPRTVQIKGDCPYYAIFATTDTFDVTFEGGNIAVDNTTYTETFTQKYEYNRLLQISAAQKTGHTFIGWSDGVTSQSRTLHITSDTTIEALYTPNIYHTTIYTTDGKNIVNKDSWQTTYSHSYNYWTFNNGELGVHSYYSSSSWYYMSISAYQELPTLTTGIYKYSFDWRTQYSNNYYSYYDSYYEYRYISAYITSSVINNNTTEFNGYVLADSLNSASSSFTNKTGINAFAFDSTENYKLVFDLYNGRWASSNIGAIGIKNIGLWHLNDTTVGSVVYSEDVAYGTTDTIQAIPNNGYHFVGWKTNLLNSAYTSTDNPYYRQTTSDVLLYAVFNINQYDISVESNISGAGEVTGSGTFDYNTEHTISATANYGYQFSHWSDGDTNATRTILLTQDTLLTAIFNPNPYTLTLYSSDVTMGNVVGSGDYFYGDSVIIRAEPEDHHHLLYWSNGSTATTDTIVILDDTELTATFAIDTYYVNVTTNNIMMGSVIGGGEFVYGTPCTVQAIAMSGYQFVRWSNGVSYNPYTFMPTTDITLTAEFVDEGQVALLTVQSADPQMGSVTGGGQYAIGNDATIEAIPNDGYHFTHWNDGNTSNPRTVTVTADATYIAYFAQDQPTQYTITLTSANLTMGSVSGGGTYNEGAEAILTAIANTGYHFMNWSDGDTNNPRSVTVFGNLSLTAYFQANVGIDNLEEYGIAVYTHRANIYVDKATGENITVYAIDGRKIASTTNAPEHVIIPVPITGVYLVEVGGYPIKKVRYNGQKLGYF